MRSLLAAILLLSAAAIGYEVLLMRMLSIVQWHHFAYMILSLALLGYAASGAYIALRRDYLERHFALAFSISALLFGVSMVVCFVAGQRIPFNALEIVWNPRQFANLAAIYLVFFLPFLFVATCIGLAFTFRKRYIARIYFFDLFGAGLGAMAIILSLFVLAPQDALKALALIALTGSALVALQAPRGGRQLIVVALGSAIALFMLPQQWLNLRVSPYKGLSQALQVIDSRIALARSSPIGMLTVVESPTIPFREAPGLALTTRFEPPQQVAVFIDGDSMTPITRWDGDPASIGHLADVTAALPYALLSSPRVLVLGAGGGADVLLALHHSARTIDAVELNPQVSDLVRNAYGGFAGHVYDRPDVTLQTGEARGFTSRTREEYDLIQVALFDSFAASGSGVQALGESYLYTTEAFEGYLRRLAPGGMLSFTRWTRLPPRDSLKLFATAVAALSQAGPGAPAERLAMIRSWNTSTLLVKNGTFSADEISRLRTFARSRSFDTVYYPGMDRDQANRFNLLDQPYFHDGAVALLGDEAGGFLARYKFRIEPATDDRPYFFNFFRWRALPEVFSLRDAGGAGLIEWGYLIVVATFLQATIAGALLILLPLSLIRRDWPRGAAARNGPYFFAIGAAFMFIEIAFIQKFILVLSHPLYAVAVVIAGFLVFAGLGSACSVRLGESLAKRGQSAITIAVTAIAAIALCYLLLLPVITPPLAGLPDGVKVAVSLLMIAPLAFCMGVPFPAGLTSVGVTAPGFIPWAWGINGYASVVSASAATLLAIEFGFSAVVIAALAAYAAAAFLMRRA